MGLARRTFLIGAAIAGGGLLVGGYMASREWDNPLLAEGVLADGSLPITPFVSVDPDGGVTVYVPRAEMGQGVQTTLAALVAEEMGLTLDEVTVNHGPASGAYYNAAMVREGGPFAFFNERLVANAARSALGGLGYVLGMQVTGGSTSTRDAFVKMRQAGAAAHAVLREVAAERLGVRPEALRQAGRSFTAAATTLGFGELAADAAALPLPRDPDLTEPRNWRLLGRSLPRVDTLAKVTGTARYGIDVDLPDLIHASIAMPAWLRSGQPEVDEAAALAVEGVERVVRLNRDGRIGFAVLAGNTWAAFRGLEALAPSWPRVDARAATTDAAIASIRAALEDEDGFALLRKNDAESFILGAAEGDVIEARYEAPFLAHATLEPMNATARLRDGVLDIWTGTQAPTVLKDLAADAVGIEPDAVHVHTQYLGGGYGRRAEVDFGVQAALLARETDGRPVKLTWRREEDMTHDFYRPAAVAHLRATLDVAGAPEALFARIAAPSTVRSMLSRTFPSLPAAGPDRLILEGAFDQPYSIPNWRVEGVDAPTDLPVGFWRSVGYSHNAFFTESFIDECAHAAGVDPMALRLSLTEPWDAAVGAIRAVAEMSDWNATEPGRAKGMAFCLSFGTWVAQVVEVEDRNGEIALTRGWCAAEIGTALDPAIIAAQLRGGMVFGLSAAIGQRIDIEDGEIVQRNFDAFDALRIGQAPPIEVEVLQTHHAMGGAGEPGVPPAAPALANAVFALTGKRVRGLPLDREISFVGW